MLLPLVTALPWSNEAFKYPIQEDNELSSNSIGVRQQIISKYKNFDSQANPKVWIPQTIPDKFTGQKNSKIVQEILRDLQKQPEFGDVDTKVLKNAVTLDEKTKKRLFGKIIRRAVERIANKFKYSRGSRKRLGRYGIMNLGKKSWNVANSNSNTGGKFHYYNADKLYI